MYQDFNKVYYIDTPYRPDPGSFAKFKSFKDDRYAIGIWHTCRELFHTHLSGLKLFFYAHEVGKGACIAEFISKIENDLDVKPRSKFGPTQRKTIMWIEPSKWWINRAMRRSLFTLLLRTGSNYQLSKDNFEEALYSHHYALDTRYAIERFLKGYTKYTGKKRGWHKQFHDFQPTQAEIDLLLIKEDK